MKHTRNYYTRYSSELLEAGKVAQGTELIRLGFALQETIDRDDEKLKLFHIKAS